jgi:hypothetical protein
MLTVCFLIVGRGYERRRTKYYWRAKRLIIIEKKLNFKFKLKLNLLKIVVLR